VIDNNGYIIISEQNITDTGRFFGEVEKPIMESMVHADIFRQLTIYDLQGLCKNVTEIKNPDDPSASSGLMTVSIAITSTPSDPDLVI
jgi:Neuronal voltage-dependent calcium channel alpha 2acd